MERYQETQQTWNKLAKLYETNFMHLDVYNTSYDRFLQQLPSNKASLLEIGCGPGNISQYLLKQRPELSILGIDTGPDMIDLAQKNNPTARFQVMDARAIDQLQQSFNGILIGFCIPYLEPADCSKLLKDCSSLLQENGILYLSFVPGDPHQSGFQTGSSGDRIFFQYYTKEWILKEVKQHRFTDVELLDINYSKNDGTTEIHTILIAKKQST